MLTIRDFCKKNLVLFFLIFCLMLPQSAQAIERRGKDIYISRAAIKEADLRKSPNDCKDVPLIRKNEGFLWLRSLIYFDVPNGLEHAFSGTDHNDKKEPGYLIFCSAKTAARLKSNGKVTQVKTAVKNYPSWGSEVLFAALQTIFLVFSYLGVWILEITSQLLGGILVAGSFITNPVVTNGWPFVQGFANLGFILALLTIAGATALQLNVGGGAKRLLPRLLIGALLINFSLVIGGILVDASRVIMALLVNFLDAGDIGMLGPKILERSGQLKQVFKYSVQSGITGFSGALENTSGDTMRTLQALVFIWAMAVSLLVLAVTMFARWIILILLLVVSPFAYLAIAFPGADSFAKRWWALFLKYVFYGPIALFMIVMLVGVTKGTNLVGSSDPGADPTLLNFAITMSMLFAVATIGKRMGGVASNFAVNAVSRAGRTAARNPKKVAAAALLTGAAPLGLLAAGAATYGAYRGGKYVGTGVKNAGKDFGRSFGGGLSQRARKNKFGRLVLGPERNKDGTPKNPADSFFDQLGRKASGDPEYKRKQAESQSAHAAIENAKKNKTPLRNNPDVLPAKLRQEHVGKDITVEQLEVLFEVDPKKNNNFRSNKAGQGRLSQEQRVALLQNPEIVKTIIESPEGATVLKNIYNLPTDAETDLPTQVGPGVNQKKADDNREANRRNKKNNRENLALLKALQDGQNKLYEKRNKGDKGTKKEKAPKP